MENKAFILALKSNWLIELYDGLIEYFMRENFFKTAWLSQAIVPNPKSIIDNCSGAGRLPLKVSQKFSNAFVEGIDGDENNIGIARYKDNSLSKVFLEHRMCCNFPINNNRADIVTSSLMLHRLTDGDQLKKLMERLHVLKPKDGIMIVNWGKESNHLMRFLFYILQFLNGFETSTSKPTSCLLNTGNRNILPTFLVVKRLTLFLALLTFTKA